MSRSVGSRIAGSLVAIALTAVGACATKPTTAPAQQVATPAPPAEPTVAKPPPAAERSPAKTTADPPRADGSTCATQSCQDLEEVAVRLAGFADSMCGCTSRACVDRVLAEMTRFADVMEKRMTGQPMTESSEARSRRIADASQRFAACSEKALRAIQAKP